MKIVQINSFSYKATGNIMMNLHRAMLAKGIDSYVVWGRGRRAEGVHEYKMTNSFDVAVHGVYSRLFDKTGFASTMATEKLVKRLESIKPDIIHLHCLHGYYINIKILFDYIRKNNIRVIWTQHDCWAFTGHCAYFDAVGCNKWKSGCSSCPQLITYPKAFVDNSKKNWLDKKNLFSGLNIHFVTPCYWLKEKMKYSFLGNYSIDVIHNGIDLNVFHHIDSDYKSKINAREKNVILGVASEWTDRKGLKDFIALDKMIDHEKWQIFLVGLTEKQQRNLPSTILSIKRTENVQELVKIYSMATIFFNPTYEDNFPTTNLEAIACGTPVVTYKTGGSPESVNETGCGVVVEKGNVHTAFEQICLMSSRKFSFEKSSLFSVERMMIKYENLYINNN